MAKAKRDEHEHEPEDEGGDPLAALDDPDRNARLSAIHRLGAALAGADLDDPGVRRAMGKLEALAADREAGHWIRKRAKRALRKIRGGAEESGES